MLLALDVGNTNITIGAFEASALVGRWRLRTVLNQTPDELGVLIRNLFSLSGLDLAAVGGIIVASVVPPLDAAVGAMAERYFHTAAMFVNHRTDTGLEIGYDNPSEVGADRVVNSVAAFHKYGGPCVVVDLGTAITFDAISREGRYLGGVICPGIGISVEALFAKTARLPLVEFRAPEKLIGTNTVGSMQSGLYYGAIGMIDGILERLFATLGPATCAVATGGEARLIVQGSKYLKDVDEDLTLVGLRLIWERNRAGQSV